MECMECGGGSVSNSFWQDRRVFITGCTGFLGSWLTCELVHRGADVIGLIRDQAPNSELVRSKTIDQIAIVWGDVNDYPLMERALAEYEIEIVFHLAAQTIVGIANRTPLSTFETNIKGTWVLLEATRRNPTVKAVVMASSDKAYGDQQQLPYTEDAPLQGGHPYDVSKSCADLIAQAYARTFEIPILITRFANLYGGGDLNWNRIVPGTIRSVLRGERPIIRSDGTFKRDYIYIQDAVSGYMLAAERLYEDQALCGRAFNFGLDKPATAREIVDTIIGLSEYPGLEPVVLDEAQNEIRDQYLASHRAHQELGWRPIYNTRRGLEEAMKWYESFLAIER
jgi:CDP-glucose 4,6-dehydratase